MTSVVIVDDQAINLKILSRFAKSLEPGVVVHTFDNPIDALECIRREPPDLVVTDYVMPMLSGEEFIQRCRQESGMSDIPIIVVTAFEDQTYRYRALDAGASEFLLSPVDGREFCIRARNLLTIWRHQQAISRRANRLESELEATLRQHAEEIKRREEQLRRVINTVPALIRASDANGRIIFLNSYHQHFFRFDWKTAVDSTKSELFGTDYGGRHQGYDRQVLDRGEMLVGLEETLIDRQGRERVLLTTKAPLFGASGKVDNIVTVSLDITERKRGEQAIRESEQRFRSLVEGSVLGIVIERDGVPLFANQTFAHIFGYEGPEAVLAVGNLATLYTLPEFDRVHRLKGPLKSTPSMPERHEFQGVKKDGTLIWIETQSQEVFWKGERARQWTVADITLRKAYEARLQRQANFDEITGLPNRVLALDRLRSAAVSAVRHNHKGGVLFIDLDHFKKINDTLGHATGDHLLKLAAERLTGCVREEDTVARLGGDEFTVILPNIASASHTEPVAHKILNTFSLPFELGRHEVFVTASVGITVFPDDSEDPAVLMQNADAAMYRAKQEGRNTFHFFTPELNRRAMDRMRIEGHLMHALDRSEFLLHYQPIVDIQSDEVIGAEALLRWSNPELGMVQPDRFISLAEDTGLIVPMGRWVLDNACRQLSHWRRAGFPHFRLSVNISSRQLRGKRLVEAVHEALQRYSVPPHSLELEITESCLMDELVQTGAALQSLHGLGVRLALDDFGTGYSCLSHLKEFPVDTVKIDKSFILNVSTHPGDATVVEAIIAMAHRLTIRVIGEGVETEEQLDFIRARGCHLAQGYYFSKPLPPEQFSEWTRRWPRAVKRAL